jgi:subtilisin family serine protease
MVELVEADLVMTAFAQTVPTGVNRIDAGASSTGVTEPVDVDIAIIDTGIGPHSDLVIEGGRRFYTVTTGPPSRWGSYEDDNYADDNGHGTHVAGTAAALDNDYGVVGVAPGARLWAVKVLGANGSGYVSDIIAGIDWVTERADTIEVVNMSLGGQGVSTAYHDAIKKSVAAGVVYVVAAGNEYRDILGSDFKFGTSDDTIPAAYPEVATISAMADSDGLPGGVGSVTSKGYADDTFADFSNFSNSDASDQSWYLVDGNNPVTSPGLGIDLMMPGVDIYSTYKNGGYATMSGTSMAAPHAAGLVALHLAENNWTTSNGARDATGDGVWSAADVYQVRQNLIASGVAWRSDNGLDAPPVGEPNSDSPDKHEENLGWAGTVAGLPSVSITYPGDGDRVADTVEITAIATDGVSQVEFFVDGTSIGLGTNDNGTWFTSWNTLALTDDTYTITATATALQTASDSVSVTVDNVDDRPFVDIIAPAENATVSGTVTIIANASDDRGVATVEFFVNDVSIGFGTEELNGLWSAYWDTLDPITDDPVYPDGPYTITATATDTALQTASDSVSVTVDNSVHSMSATLASRVTTIGKSKWQAFVTATVVDDGDPALPLEGVIVVGNWTGDYIRDAVSGVTNSAGTVTFQTPTMTSGSLVTFTVTNVALDGYQYAGSYPSLSVSRYSTSSKAAELDALYQYLATTAQSNKNKKDADDQIEAVDLLMAYGM